MIRSPWLRAAALTVPVLLLLTGCEPRVGTAAFVGDKRISEARLEKTANLWLRDPAVAKTVGNDVSGYRRHVLGRLIKHDVLAGAADKLGVRIADRQVLQSLSETATRFNGRQQVEAALAQDPYRLPRSEVLPFFRDFVLLGEIGRRLTERQPFSEAELTKFYAENNGPQSGQTFQQVRQRIIEILGQQRAERYVLDYVREVRVRVNPRYGRFDASRLFDQQESPLLVPVRDNLVVDTTQQSAAPRP